MRIPPDGDDAIGEEVVEIDNCDNIADVNKESEVVPEKSKAVLDNTGGKEVEQPKLIGTKVEIVLAQP